MLKLSHSDATLGVATSPLMLSDRLLTLAEDAGRAGFQITADRLVRLAYRVFDEAQPAARRLRRLRPPELTTH
jgi:hypothetical protein